MVRAVKVGVRDRLGQVEVEVKSRMKIAVCVKYVPVVARMTFDYENKTINREGVPSEINPFDLLGLVRAGQLKSSPPDQVVVLSMGPPSVKEGLVQCLALGKS